MTCFGCILDLLHCFVCQSSLKYPNYHILTSIHPFDPISSPFLICMSLACILMRCERLWAGLFWLYFGPSALFCVCQSSPKYPNCHILASIHQFDPISSSFLMWMSLASILMHWKWLWAGSFWLYFGPSVLFWLSIVPQIPNCSQTAISRLLFVRLTPSLHHSSSG